MYTGIIIFLLVIPELAFCSKTHHKCATDTRCRCILINQKEFRAICSYIGLRNAPKFNDSVTEIDLSYNKLTAFPQKSTLPKKLRYLDISQNLELSYIAENSFDGLSHLEYLDLSGSQKELGSSVLVKGIFKDLKSLKFLNLKNNNPRSPRSSYPVGAFTDLDSIETLLLNGKPNGFGPVFTKMKKLTKIDISGYGGYCDLSYIPTDYFHNVSHVSVLDISDCRLKNLDQGTFSYITSLRDLNISKNEELSFSIFRNLTSDLKFTKIEKLRMSKIHCTFGLGTEILRDDIRELQNTSLLELHVDSNRIESLETGVMMLLPKSLRHVSITDNRLTFGWYALETAYLKNLTYYDMSLQYLSHYPSNIFPLCDDRRTQRQVIVNNSNSYMEVDKFYNRTAISSLGSFDEMFHVFSMNVTIPLNLEVGFFNKSTLRYPIPILSIGKNNLKRLYAQDNTFYEWTGPMIGFNSLELVDLSNNFCSKLSSHFFDYFPSLKTLKISDNLLGFSLATDEEGLSFKNLHNLSDFDLSSNKIQMLPESIFKNLVSMEYLQLSQNLLRSFESRIQHMKSLKLLNLSHNQLSELSPKLTQQLDAISKRRDRAEIKIDLTGNPLQCNCEHIEFLRWKTKSSVNVTFDFCKTKYGKAKFKDLADVLLRLETECKSYTSIIVLGCCMIVVTLTVIVCAIIYRFRWKLRYLYYMTKSHYFGYTRVRHDDDEEEDDIYDFDAFISYADEDRSFGLHEMLKNVEEAGNLRICCHNRDFIPGVDIAENITRAIHSSRRTICVMSPNYLNSYWCRFELNMARMESIYSRKGEEILFLVLYKGIDQCEIPSLVIDLIDKKSYIEYPDDPQGNVVFWNNIRRTISMQI
ncbi:hypothetical protein FSP39_003875 [Pinctada imbricata]|uniref:TIR domain-containing protein n=1 Tax=Pinctada imbricata TaxID=66713 RepID=A0AA89C0P2_PINIB|nr:hypothetical protein FSP39_003875 [Pinctada imbricata]